MHSFSQLHVAAANGYIDVLNFLLDQPDIKVNIQDNEGWTPFHAAVCWEQVSILVLLSAGHLLKPFFFTIMQKEAMEILAKKGADLEQEDIHGDTPFGKRAYPYISKFNWVNIVYKEECTNLSDVCTDL